MTYIPTGIVKLCSVPDIDAHNSLYFDTEQAKFNYFNSKAVKTYEKVNYIRRSNSIKLQITYNELLSCNYIMYQNTNFTTQWIYAKITNYDFINANTYKVSFAIDCWITWQNKLTFKDSYVKRHTIPRSEDIPGTNLLAENFDFSNYVWEENTFRYLVGGGVTAIERNYVVVECNGSFNSDHQYRETKTYIRDVMYNSSFTFFSQSNYGFLKFGDFINRLNSLGKMSEVISIKFLPDTFFDIDSYRLNVNTWKPAGEVVQDGDDTTPRIVKLPDLKTVREYDLINSFNVSDTGRPATYYTPKNKKILTFPYMKWVLSDMCGSSIILFQEFMNTNPDTGKYEIFLNINMGEPSAIIAYPLYYNGGERNNAIVSNKIGQMTVTFDSAKNYLALNRNTIGFNQEANKIAKFENIASGVFQTIEGLQRPQQYLENTAKSLLTGNLNGLSQVAGQQALTDTAQDLTGAVFKFIKSDFPERKLTAQLDDVALMPNNSQGSRNSEMLNVLDGYNGIFMWVERLPYSKLKVIDDYFEKFGYNISMFKPITFHNRSQWEYYETSNISINGNVPDEEIEVIKGMFNNGFRVWYNPNNFLNYNVTNS